MPKKAKTSKKKQGETNGIEKPKAVDVPMPPSPIESPVENNESEPMNVDVDPSVEADRFKEQGNVEFKAGRYDAAIALYTRAIELKSTEPTFFTNRAACNMALKKFRHALADCQNASTLQAASPVPKTLVRLAKCHLALGTPGPALSAVRAALAVDRANADAKKVEAAAERVQTHLSRVAVSRAKKDWKMARLALDQAVKECEGPEPIEWRCWRIEFELAKSKLDEAMIAANQAFQLDKVSPEVLCLRGLVMFLSGKLPSALQHAQQALTYDPEHKRARQLLKRIKDVDRLKEEGNTLFKTKQLPEAIEKYTEALAVIGSADDEAKGGTIRATLLSNRATALVKLERYDDALNDTNASLVLVSTSYKALRTRARIHLAKEEYDAAITDFKASLEQVRIEGSQAEERNLKQELKDAEIALKRSKSKDYYKILGVPKEATEIEIKKAYRKMSLVHHPDKGGDEEKFKLASEAYSILSDSQKRARRSFVYCRYDAGEDDETGGNGFNGMNQTDLADLFAAFGGGGGPQFNFGGGGGYGGGNGYSGGGSRSYHSHGFNF
ncbi:hypothetical protein M422DRAFT_70960 [Sphaerobolus stellatus SS14]|uniref:J domain-containing protein n=1 Tax=Sphaerobolus stellatus (strain SS14) TaxID=990650 RepID=A0A0C9U8G5_SPHS4|nr:hypothetical protein M422DRAFT_70960 [Sphaerobolus stellatus SS14]